MVRNTKGGKGSKALARKLVTSDSSFKRCIRKPENELEVLAITTKMYGTMCEVVTYDGKTYKCQIRGKFRGRAKRNSIVSVGKILMVGFREFEGPNYKICDLLEVYESNEINELQKIPGINLKQLMTYAVNLEAPNMKNESNDNIIFSDEIDEYIAPQKKPPVEDQNNMDNDQEEEWIDFDDI